MRMSWKIGRVAGIDLYLHATFLLLLAYGAFRGVDVLLLVSAVFGCVVLHELGHALTARLYGIPTRDITLYPIGGIARLERMPRAPGAEFLITLAGPLVNVAIAAILAIALRLAGMAQPGSMDSEVAGFFSQLMWVNVVLAVFNMIPAFPMDGGRILRALLTLPLGRYRATQIAANLGRIVAIAFPIMMSWLGAFSILNLFLAVFLFAAATSELALARAEEDERNGWGNGGGIRTAPAGYRWVSQGNGLWQLSPIVVQQNSRGPRQWS